MTNAVNLAALGSTGVSLGFKNRIINGAMVIDQRNAGGAVTVPSLTVTYTLDRYFAYATQASKYSVQQNAGSVTPPLGFTNYLGVTSSSAYSVGSGDIFFLSQRIEGYNIADLNWGTANAKTITVSFQVYSSLTGTFGGALRNSAATRSYPFTYTISSPNTWTSITITIPGDTTGTWLTTNGIGIDIDFSMGSGSSFATTAGAWAAGNFLSATGATNVVSTNGATFYITGVQLEVGSSATGFEYRQYGQELALCQRYLPIFNGSGMNWQGVAANTTLSDYILEFIVTPRTPPTGITTTGTFGVSNLAAGGAATLSFQGAGNSNISIRATTSAGSPTISQGVGTVFYNTSTASIICTGCEL